MNQVKGESWAHREWLLCVDTLPCAGDLSFPDQARGDSTSWGADFPERGFPSPPRSKDGDAVQKEGCGRSGRAGQVCG